MRRLLLPLLLGVVSLGTLLAVTARDLITAGSARAPEVIVEVGLVYRLAGGRPASRVISAAQWWRSAPTLVVAVGAIALLVAAMIVAVKHGVFAPRVGRLLQTCGLLALIGGPAAVLVAALAPRWTGGDWARTALWPQALVWAVVGGGLLAVRDVLVRAGAMRSELDGVI